MVGGIGPQHANISQKITEKLTAIRGAICEYCLPYSW